ncbi:hypothetical protein [Candidatus Palauibacter sp.]|uniref:hypothetical protein n=1 Tax=Candidatus Palauibacter sp. TaxID=3101350 RepID=UPI003B51A9EA
MHAPLEPQEAGGVGAVDGAIGELVDERVATWRQAECVVEDAWFLYRTSAQNPLTDAGGAAVVEGAENAETSVLGFAILTQTCDLVRPCADRPFVEVSVSPLVEVDDLRLHEIERGRRPNYGFIPGVAHRRLVADLDRIMTVEKPVVAGWERIEGCRTDDETRRFSLALARKRARTAFPDDFVVFAKPLMERMSERHDRQSDEGRVLSSLREVRVRAAPSWDADAVELTFWFVRNDDEPAFEIDNWELCLTALPQPESTYERFVRVDGVVLTLDDLTARDFVESDPLDLDHLSTREG